MENRNRERLTSKQERFCLEYLIDLNATQAAIKAGYSPKTARQQASRLLTNVNIIDRIAQLRKEQSERLQIDADRVIMEMARIAFLDPKKLFDEDGRLLKIHDMDKETAAVIQGVNIRITRNKDGRKSEHCRIKLASKTHALEQLGRHFDLFKDTKNHQVEPIQIFSEPELKK